MQVVKSLSMLIVFLMASAASSLTLAEMNNHLLGGAAAPAAAVAVAKVAGPTKGTKTGFPDQDPMRGPMTTCSLFKSSNIESNSRCTTMACVRVAMPKKKINPTNRGRVVLKKSPPHRANNEVEELNTLKKSVSYCLLLLCCICIGFLQPQTMTINNDDDNNTDMSRDSCTTDQIESTIPTNCTKPKHLHSEGLCVLAYLLLLSMFCPLVRAQSYLSISSGTCSGKFSQSNAKVYSFLVFNSSCFRISYTYTLFLFYLCLFSSCYTHFSSPLASHIRAGLTGYELITSATQCEDAASTLGWGSPTASSSSSAGTPAGCSLHKGVNLVYNSYSPSPVTCDRLHCFCLQTPPIPCDIGANWESCGSNGSPSGTYTGQNRSSCFCNCTNSYTGENCATPPSCTTGANGQSCGNHGSPSGTYNGISTTSCSCDCFMEYTGENCETPPPIPCDIGANLESCGSNGSPSGTYTGQNKSSCFCTCTNSYKGENCDVQQNCGNGGIETKDGPVTCNSANFVAKTSSTPCEGCNNDGEECCFPKSCGNGNGNGGAVLCSSSQVAKASETECSTCSTSECCMPKTCGNRGSNHSWIQPVTYSVTCDSSQSAKASTTPCTTCDDSGSEW